MKVYVFGNRDLSEDNAAFKVLDKLKGNVSNIEFVEIAPNENLPFADGEDVVILDAVAGLTEVRVLELKNLDKLIMSPRNSVHDFDLGFQLKYLKKLGKLGNIKIIGLPMKGMVDYDSIQSILRKLVAQDIQGS